MSITSAKTGATGISLALDNNYMEPIATTLVGSGGTNSIIFNDIPQTYKHLQIRCIGRTTHAQYYGRIDFRLNGDSTSNYYRHMFFSPGTGSIGAYGYTGESVLVAGYLSGSSSASNMFGGFILDILNYTDTNIYKTIRSFGGSDCNSTGDTYIGCYSGTWQNLNPITSLNFLPELSTSIFSQNTRISLYGIKG